MATIIPVRFAYAARDLWFDPGQTGAQEGDHLICSTERGTEIGLATAGPSEVSRSALGRKTGGSNLKPVLRVASEGDLERAENLVRMGEEAMPTFRRFVDESGLDMKPVGVEYLFGRERVVCYFAADERVDFRQLVRNLSHELHERIDMRQIGVREEAAVVGGFGHCGQELCCARFGLSFEPVSIRMAKEQDLPLTSNKISGACGRLMCCLRYEFEAYRDFKGRAPKRNAVIDTPLGKAKIIEYDTPKEQLALRLENGKTIRVPLGEMVASEAAVKKSEELHCPCRPDTVLRASLEKLSSPDVQMALAEIDRKMGVLSDDDYDAVDLFTESKPRKRRRRGPAQENGASDDAATRQDGTETKPSRRRRRRSTARGTSEAEQRGQTQQSGADQGGSQDAQGNGEKRTRRRRRRRSGAEVGTDSGVSVSRSQNVTKPAEGQAAEGSGEGTASENRTRRRRRHRTSTGGGNGSGGQQQQQQQSQKSQQDKPKRRPGDRGGQATPKQPAGGTGRQTDGASNAGGGSRRRRRRSGRGRGGNGGAGTGTQAQAPKA